MNVAPLPVSNEWRKWLAEVLLMGFPIESAKQTLLDHGFSASQIEKELADYHSNPYVQGAAAVADRFQKREWLLEVFNFLRLKKTSGAPLQEIAPPAFKDFLRDYYYANEACILKGAAKAWPCMKWDMQYLLKKVGEDTEVSVQGNRESNKQYDRDRDAHTRKIKFGRFIDMLNAIEAENKSSNDFYLTAHNTAANQHAFKFMLSEVGNIADGYLDGRKEVIENACRIWLGPNGVITPSHFDNTNVLIVQVIGKKRVLLTPPTQLSYMYNYDHFFSGVDVFNPDLVACPHYKNATVYDVLIEPGDALFVPVGWWHAIQGVGASLSLSMMNFNAPNNTELPKMTL